MWIRTNHKDAAYSSSFHILLLPISFSFSQSSFCFLLPQDTSYIFPAIKLGCGMTTPSPITFFLNSVHLHHILQELHGVFPHFARNTEKSRENPYKYHNLLLFIFSAHKATENTEDRRNMCRGASIFFT